MERAPLAQKNTGQVTASPVATKGTPSRQADARKGTPSLQADARQGTPSLQSEERQAPTLTQGVVGLGTTQTQGVAGLGTTQTQGGIRLGTPIDLKKRPRVTPQQPDDGLDLMFKDMFGDPNHFDSLIQSIEYRKLKQHARGTPSYGYLEEATDEVFQAGKYPEKDYKTAVKKIAERMLQLLQGNQAKQAYQGDNSWYQEDEEMEEDYGDQQNTGGQQNTGDPQHQDLGYEDYQNTDNQQYDEYGYDDQYNTGNNREIGRASCRERVSSPV